MKRSGLTSWVCFLALVLAIGAALAMLGRLHAVFEEDSKTYLDFDSRSLRAALSQVRTVGYPLFLTSVGHMGAIPVVQFLAHSGAVALFWRGLIAAGYSPWTAFWCAGVLLLGRGAFDLGMLVTADSLAISCAIAATGCFLAATAVHATKGSWMGLAGFTFAAYQVRPAYLFLIPLWPLTSLMLDACLLRRRDRWREHVRRSLAFGLITVGPFLAFCALRLVCVGHFGLVAFGGHNMIGIAGQFLDPPLVAELPPDMQPFAREMLTRRQVLDGYIVSDDFLVMEAMYNPTVWQLAVPLATEIHRGDSVEVNRLLSGLAWEIVRRRPGQYARWLVANANHARRRLTMLVAFDKGCAAILIIYLLAQFWELTSGRGTERQGTPIAEPCAGQRRLETQVLLWTSLMFAGSNVLLVILVEPANDRYMTGAMVLIPAALAVWLAQYGSTVWPRVAAGWNQDG